MDRDIWIGVGCFIAFVVVLALLMGGPILQSRTITENAVKLPLLAIVGIMALLASIAIVSVTFSLAGLSDKSQALGLPEGSVRAVIALSLIVLFAITSVFLHSSLSERGLQRTAALSKADADAFAARLRSDELVGTEPSGADRAVVVYRLGTQASEDFAKQVFTLIGTLMTAVASFYFAARTVNAVQQQNAAAASPIITGVSPATGAAGSTVSVDVAGSGLQLARSVRLVQGATAIEASDVMSNDAVAKATFTLDPGTPTGAYDVVVTTTDGTAALKARAFTVT